MIYPRTISQELVALPLTDPTVHVLLIVSRMSKSVEICRLVNEGVKHFYSQNELRPVPGAREDGCPPDTVRTDIKREMPDWMTRGGPSFSHLFMPRRTKSGKFALKKSGGETRESTENEEDAF